MDSNYLAQIFKESKKFGASPKLGLIIGSGLTALTDLFDCKSAPYSSIQNFPQTTVSGHSGVLFYNSDIAICSGRFHYYEGHSPDQVVSTVALLYGMGCRKIILTNAAGGINKEFSQGDIMLITDHINLMGFNPLIGQNPVVNGEPCGPRFCDMTSVYSKAFAIKALEFDGRLQSGVYLAISGPTYETPAEIRAFSQLQADAVGMSTVPEAILAQYLGMEVAGISLITNLAAGLSGNKLDHQEVIQTSARASERMKSLVSNMVSWWL